MSHGLRLAQRLMFCIILISLAPAGAADWPMWRYDANRSAASPYDLPNQLELQWTRTYNTRQQVWDDPLNHDLMPYDQVFEPVVVGKTIFLPFNDTDKLVALDTDRGTHRWIFYTDGPIRLPPATTADRI